jgi:hypothetical protein
VSFKVCAERCDQCLFSKTPIVSDTRRKQVLRDCARRDTHFICHKHGHGAGGELAGEDVCCRGFYDANPMRTNLMRIAHRLGAVEFVGLASRDSLAPNGEEA